MQGNLLNYDVLIFCFLPDSRAAKRRSEVCAFCACRRDAKCPWDFQRLCASSQWKDSNFSSAMRRLRLHVTTVKLNIVTYAISACVLFWNERDREALKMGFMCVQSAKLARSVRAHRGSATFATARTCLGRLDITLAWHLAPRGAARQQRDVNFSRGRKTLFVDRRERQAHTPNECEATYRSRGRRHTDTCLFTTIPPFQRFSWVLFVNRKIK